MNTHRSLLAFLLAAFALSGCICGPTVDPPAGETSVDVDATFTCNDKAGTEGTLTVDSLSLCAYRPADDRLEILVENGAGGVGGGDFITINIVGFTEAKSYTTTDSEDATGDTYVSVLSNAGEQLADTHSSALDPCAASECTIDVTNSDIIDVGAGSTGRAAATVSCANLRLSSGCDTCVFTPSTWTFDIADCTRDD
jgi:hypothetical protein